VKYTDTVAHLNCGSASFPGSDINVNQLNLFKSTLIFCGGLLLNTFTGGQAGMASTSSTVSAGSSLPRPEHPRPDFYRSDWLNLNGEWQFEIDAGVSGEDRKIYESSSNLKQKIIVPFCPESKLSGIANKDFMPCVWYKREFTLPTDWTGQRVLLHFGACDYDTRVWINGTHAGDHRGGYSSFSFDISDELKPGENTVVVRALDNTQSTLQPKGKQCPKFASEGCLYTRTTGIWQTVWLEAVPQVYIKSFHLTPDISQKQLLVSAEIANFQSGGQLVAEAFADGQSVGKTILPAASSLQFSIPLSRITLWEPGKSYLYDLKLTLSIPGQKPDNISSYFGMREISIAGKKVLINGKPVFQRLVLDQGFYPDGIYTAPDEESLKKDIELSMALGFNGARLHQKVFEPRYLYWADKMGYLVWGEYASWGLDHSAPLALERVLPEWLEVLERDYNHPAIIGWCPFNETPENQNPELLRTVYRASKAADRTRPVIDTSGYVHVETDIYDSHNYEQDPAKFAALFKDFETTGMPYRNTEHEALYQGQPYFVSEYGGIWWNPKNANGNSWGYGERPQSIDDYIERYRGLTNALLQNSNMFGFCYTQLTDVEQEQNGLYTYDREPKFDAAKIRAINTQVAAIEKEQ
jgi:beta-galactosidase/beta-glucuronidase